MVEGNVYVLFEVALREGREDDYLARVAALKELLAQEEGFVRSERFSSLAVPRKLLSLSVWESEEAVERWRNVVEHRASQRAGRELDFEDYAITVASPLRCYSISDRAQAPGDSDDALGI